MKAGLDWQECRVHLKDSANIVQGQDLAGTPRGNDLPMMEQDDLVGEPDRSSKDQRLRRGPESRGPQIISL
ncbi:MAG: hypothetical protein ABR607_12840 [Pyrinomonadaceae bacterium]